LTALFRDVSAKISMSIWCGFVRYPAQAASKQSASTIQAERLPRSSLSAA
jgi:hypothetical protein